MLRLLGLTLLFITSTCIAQQKEVSFTENFEGIRWEDFVKKIESSSGFTFFYDARQLDSVTINVRAKNLSIEQLLDTALSGTGVFFSIDKDNRVFITRRFKVQTRLPEGYTGIAKSPQVPDSILIPVVQKKQITTAAVPNKVYEVGSRTPSMQGNATITGVVRNAKTGEPVVNISIIVDRPRQNVVTDQYGYYSLTIPTGSRKLFVQGLGMKDSEVQLILNSNGKLDIEMTEKVISLKEVIVSAVKLGNISRVNMGVERIDIKTIKQIPALFGEADVLKAVLTTPGVKTVGEASAGFNVRGGSTDQNLILFNEATVYNPSHFFGMFSAFNPDVVKTLELYKSGIPAKYGGRLSSVLDITGKEGNKKEFHGIAGVGILTSRLNLDGPLIKDKTSFVIGGRTTYSNWLLGLLPKEYRDSKASFYDVNVLLSHKMNDRNDFYLTTYLSNDKFNLNNDTTYKYSNKNVSLKWKKVFNSKWTGTLVAGYDRYEYSITSDRIAKNAYKLQFDINQKNLKLGFNHYLNSKHTIEFGASAISYQLNPGSYTPLGNESLVVKDIVSTEQAFETAGYISERFNISDDLSVQAGIRYSMYYFLGPGNMNVYKDGEPKTENSKLETKAFGKGDIIRKYHGPEYRISARYAFSNSFSIKAGYNSLRQFIHMLSNTTSIAPTDIWKLSDGNIKPQYGDQYSIGAYKNFKSNTIETYVEIYYKRIENYLDYKPGAKLILNHTIETDVIGTKGKAYGVEVMAKKQTGKLNGWISYTYSRILLKADDLSQGTLINQGKEYPANYDKPHDVTCIANYRVNHRFSISTNLTYSTGRPITLPVGRYYYSGGQRVLYSDRNTHRVPDYFRCDLSMNIEGNHKVKQKTHNSWSIGVYNLTGRRNAFSVFFVTENGDINSYKLSIFGSVIPFVNYNIRF